MELQQFVAEAITQVINGVKDAQAATADTGADVNPQGMRFIPEQVGSRQWDTRTEIFAEQVEFDVAVSVESRDTNKGGFGIVVGTLSLGAAKQKEKASSAMSRIRFRVPVVFPPGGWLRHADGQPVTRGRVSSNGSSEIELPTCAGR
jgi:hypothetical protein